VMEDTYGLRLRGVRWWHRFVILYFNLTHTLSFLFNAKRKDAAAAPTMSSQESAEQMQEESDYEDHEEDEIWSGLWRPRAFVRHFVEIESESHHVLREDLMAMPGSDLLGEDSLEDLLEERIQRERNRREQGWRERILEAAQALWRCIGLHLVSWQYPARSDGDFEGYHARVEALYNPGWKMWLMGGTATRYGTVLNNGEHKNPGQYRWQTGFLEPFTDRVGLGTWGHYSTVFAGNYNHSFGNLHDFYLLFPLSSCENARNSAIYLCNLAMPAGVHWDAESVWHVPVIGRKAMRTWQPRHILANPQLMNMTNYATAEPASLLDSVLVCAEPGGVLYWNRQP